MIHDDDDEDYDESFHRMQDHYRKAVREWKEAARPGYEHPVGAYVIYHGVRYKVAVHAPGGDYHLDGPFGSRACNVSPGDIDSCEPRPMGRNVDHEVAAISLALAGIAIVMLWVIFKG